MADLSSLFSPSKKAKKNKKKMTHEAVKTKEIEETFVQSYELKKKKKQKRVVEMAEEPEPIIHSSESAKKKKKKQKDLALAEEPDTLAQPFESPKKQKKLRSAELADNTGDESLLHDQNHANMSRMNETVADFLEPEPLDKWSLQEDILLLKTLKENAPKSKDSFRQSIKSLKFENVLPPKFTRNARESKERIEYLFGCISSLKTFEQMAGDVLEDIRSIRNIKKKSPYDRWALENESAIFEYMHDNECTRDEASKRLWENLSENDRKYFSKRKRAMIKQSPFELYLDAYINKNGGRPGEARQQARKVYSAMKNKKKFKYISKYIADSLSLAALDADSESLEQEVKALILSKEEAKIYLEKNGLPQIPTKSVNVFYFREAGLSIDNPRLLLATSLQTFKKIPLKEQQMWHAKYNKMWEDFNAEYKAWIESQPPFVPFIIKYYHKALYNLFSEKKTKRLGKSKEFNTIEMPFGMIPFEGEPKLPPMSIFGVLKQTYLKKKGINLTTEQAKAEYKILPKEDLSKLNKVRDDIVNLCKKKVLQFVAQLPEEQRKVFLGTRRLKYYRIFRNDIFEEQYPNEVFPLYHKPRKGRDVEQPEVKESDGSESDGQDDPFTLSPIANLSKLSKRELTTSSDEEESFSLSPSKKPKKEAPPPDSSDDGDDSEQEGCNWGDF